MIGRVNDDYEAIVEVAVRLGGVEIRIPAVVDTGFSEFLVLPYELLATLGPAPEREEQLTLGNGEIASMSTYVVEVEWSGGWKAVKAYGSEGEALVGMKLLLGCDLFVRVTPDGEVRIEPT